MGNSESGAGRSQDTRVGTGFTASTGPHPTPLLWEDQNFLSQGGAALQPCWPPGGAEQRLRQSQRPAGADLHVEWGGQCPGEDAPQAPPHLSGEPPQAGRGRASQPPGSVDTGSCQAGRGWSCPSPVPSWSWTPSMPTRRAAYVGTSTGCRPSMSSTPTVSAARGQGVAEGWTVPGRLGRAEWGVASSGPWAESKSEWTQCSTQQCPQEVSGVLAWAGVPLAATPRTAPRAPQHPHRAPLLHRHQADPSTVREPAEAGRAHGAVPGPPALPSRQLHRRGERLSGIQLPLSPSPPGVGTAGGGLTLLGA